MNRPTFTFLFFLLSASSCSPTAGTDPTGRTSTTDDSHTGGVASGGASAATGGNESSNPGAGSGGEWTASGSGGTTNGDATGGTGTVGTGGAASSGGGGTADSGDVCAQLGVLLCEDFESGVAGQAPGAPWSLAVNGADGTAVIDATAPANSGSQSVKVSSLGNYQIFFAIKEAPVFPAPAPALYARVYLRLDEPMTEGHNTYFKAGAAGAISSDNETRVGVMNEMLMINQPDGDRGVLSNQNFWTDMKPGLVIPADTWTCIESFFDPPNSTVQFWVDGVEVPDLHVTDWQQDELGSLHFGFEKYAGPDAVIWYDDIVISTQPIGCGAIAN